MIKLLHSPPLAPMAPSIPAPFIPPPCTCNTHYGHTNFFAVFCATPLLKSLAWPTHPPLPPIRSLNPSAYYQLPPYWPTFLSNLNPSDTVPFLVPYSSTIVLVPYFTEQKRSFQFQVEMRLLFHLAPRTAETGVCSQESSQCTPPEHQGRGAAHIRLRVMSSFLLSLLSLSATCYTMTPSPRRFHVAFSHNSLPNDTLTPVHMMGQLWPHAASWLQGI